jgi:hypothetical protein
MRGPVYFDLEAIERNARHATATTIAEARERAQSDEDQKFVDIQEELYELAILATCKLAGLRNREVDPNIVAKAMGNVIGSMSANAYRNFGSNSGASRLLVRATGEAFQALLRGTSDHGIVRQTSVQGIQGGLA